MDINAYIIGEHGKTQFATMSHAMTGGARLEDVLQKSVTSIHNDWIHEAEDEARRAGFEIFYARGYTNYAVGMAVEMIVESIVHDSCVTLPVSVLIDGFCGAREVCLSIPCVVGHGGVKRRLEPELDEEEQGKFVKSAKAVRGVIETLAIDELRA